VDYEWSVGKDRRAAVAMSYDDSYKLELEVLNTRRLRKQIKFEAPLRSTRVVGVGGFLCEQAVTRNCSNLFVNINYAFNFCGL
jgi:hypothetical protein